MLRTHLLIVLTAPFVALAGVALAGLALTGVALAEKPLTSSAPAKSPLLLHHPLQDKNFYLLTLLQEDPAVHAALLKDPTLSELTAERQATEATAIAVYDQSVPTYVQNQLWTEAQLRSIAEALRALYRSDAHLRSLVSGPLRHSGIAGLVEGESDEEVLVRTWTTEAQGINGILQTYGLGKPPLYPQIDSVSYDPNSLRYREAIHQAAYTAHTGNGDPPLFFEVSLHFALYLLQANRRDEAARFEPLEFGENAAAIARIPQVDWGRYRYSVILIPGIGPELPGTPLSPMGTLHVAAAAERYQQGVAPFILLSGGYVHPSQTPFSEAVEMKRALMHDYGIPENAILVDPHARHTTTNFRNAARAIYRYDMPFDKPALVTSDLYQSQYIENANFPKRCLRELGTKCFLQLRRTSPIDQEWLPSLQSLQQNPADPLDP